MLRPAVEILRPGVKILKEAPAGPAESAGVQRGPARSRRDLRKNCAGPKNPIFPSKKVLFSLAGMDRSTLISQIGKKETILATSFLVRLAFLNRVVLVPTGTARPGRECVSKPRALARGIEEKLKKCKGK